MPAGTVPIWCGTTTIPYPHGVRIAKAADRPQARSMPAPPEPKLPSLLPFVAMAAALLLVYGAVLLFPALKGFIGR